MSDSSKFSLPIFPVNTFAYQASYNQFIKVSGMLDLSNFVRLFHRQSFVLYGTLLDSHYIVKE